MNFLMGLRGSSDDSAPSAASVEQYKQMRKREHEILQQHEDLASVPVPLRMLVNSDSMDLQNDPRFFQDNILNTRLAALSGMSVVSGLMVTICTEVLESRKNLTFETWNGRVRCCNFLLLSLVLFLNTVATYVPMAQTYHTYRLETAGPTGFEIACSYYLNRNIVAWRHFSVFCLLNGLTFYLVSYGVRLTVSFSEASTPKVTKDNAVDPYCAFIMAWIVGLFYLVGGFLMWYIHQKHQAVFRTNYELAKESERPYMNVVNDLVTSHRSRSNLRGPEV